MPHTFRNKQKPISLELAGMISLLLLIIYVFFLYIFWKKRNHPLINYRPILLCINTGFWSGVYNVLLPVSYFGNNINNKYNIIPYINLLI